MSGEYKELVDFMGERFEWIGDQFDQIHQELGRKANASDVRKILSNLDTYAKHTDDLTQEMVMLSGQVGRHDRWIHQLADKSELKLDSG